MYFTTKLPLGGLLVRIDLDPVKLADQYSADVRVWSDARSALHSINQALAGRAQEAVTRAGWRLSIGGGAKIYAWIGKNPGLEGEGPPGALGAHQKPLSPWRRAVNGTR